MTSRGVSQIKLINGTINSRAYQDNIMKILNSNMYVPCPKASNKITYYVIALQSVCAYIKGLGSDLIDHLIVQIGAP